MKFFKNKLAVTVIVLSVTFLVIIGYTSKKQGKDKVSSAVGVTLNPVQKVFYSINDNVKGFLNFIFNFSDVKSENTELKKKNSELSSKSIEYDSLKNENQRLREMLDFKSQRDEYNYIGANIINKAGGSILESFTIDKGLKHGVKVGMVAIDPKGLVGQVTDVTNSWSTIQPITSENVAVGALVESTRDTTGVVKGYRDNNKAVARLEYIDANSEIKEGDVILTSASGDSYPKEIKIGVVLSIKEDKAKMGKTAIVEPYVDFNKLEELYLVVPTSNENNNIKY